MPKLIVPDEKVITSQGSERSIGGEASAIASAVKLGELASRDGAGAAANRAKLGTIQRTQGAEALANTGREIGDLIGKKEAAAAASYAQIGQTALQAGQSVMAAGNSMYNRAMSEMADYIQKARGAVDDGIYNNTYSSAVKEFHQRTMDRMGKPYDDKGNPTFASLSADVGSIAEDIKAKYSGQLGDNPELLQRFDSNFTNLATNQQISAMKEARGQQIDYSKKSLENFLNTNTGAALSSSDRAALPTYLASANERVDSAYKNGYISYEQSLQLKDKARHDIHYGYLESLAQKEPNTVFNDLGMDASIKGLTNDQLGITPTERAKLVDITAKRITEQRQADQMRVTEEKALIKEQQTINTNHLDLGITQGMASVADIEAHYNEGKISNQQMESLKQKVISENKKGMTKAQTRQAISSDINSGKLIANKYSSTAINDHFSSQIETTGAQDLFNPSAPMDRTRLAAQYRAPVPQFTNELDSVAKNGSPEQVLQAVNAYRYVSQKSPLAVSKMNSKTQAFYSIMDSQTKYSNTDPAKAIERAHNLAFNATDEQYKVRRNEWDNKGSPFAPGNLDGTISSMYDLGHGVFTDDKISSFAKNQLTKQLKDAYVLTGDFEAAKTMVQSQTKGVFGTSELNKMSQWTRDNSVFMFAPPEATYGYGTPTNFSPEEMRANLEHDVSGMLVKSDYIDQSGIKPEQIMVGSGEFTSRSMGNAAYSLYYIDQSGHEQPIINPSNGQPVFWKPDAGFISDYRVDQSYKALEKATRVQRVSEAGTLKSLYNPTPEFKKPTLLSKDPLAQGSHQAVVNTALSFIGVSEQKDRDALGRVMTKMTGQSVDPAQTPWCAAFVNTVLKANGLSGTGSLSARSFLQYGKATNRPTQGDIVVMSRGSDPSKGHVGFFMGYDKSGNILVLGGNQSDSVNVKSVNPNSVLSIRDINAGDSTATDSVSTSTQAYPVSDVVGFRTLPSGEEVQQIMSSGPMQSVPNKALPIGLRQNNPGNVTKNGVRWQGEVPNASSKFKEFASPEDGIAAIVNNLKTNYLPKGANTIEKIVKKWTATKSDHASYIKNLSEATGLAPDEKFDMNSLQPKQLVGLVRAMIKQENGYNPYADVVIMNGILRGQ